MLRIIGMYRIIVQPFTMVIKGLPFVITGDLPAIDGPPIAQAEIPGQGPPDAGHSGAGPSGGSPPRSRPSGAPPSGSPFRVGYFVGSPSRSSPSGAGTSSGSPYRQGYFGPHHAKQ